MPGTNYNAPVYGVKVVLTRGSYRVTFNDSTDSDNIGSLTNIDGLDSPTVREQGENLQEFDGGIHADRFFYGRRPIMLEGVVHGHATVSARNTNLQKLMDVTNAMRDDMTMTWQPAGGFEVSVALRRQQPLRIEGLGPNKTFAAGMVAADPRIYSTTTVTQSLGASGTTVTNSGSTEAFPIYYVTGKTTANARLTVDGKYVASFTNGLAPDYVYTIDSLKRTVLKGARSGFRRNSFPNPSFEKTAAPQYASLNGFVSTFNPFAAMPTPSSGWGTHVASVVANGSIGFAGFELLNPDGSGYWPYPYLAKATMGVSALAAAGAALNSLAFRVDAYNASNSLVLSDTQTASALSTSWQRFTLNHTNLGSGSTKARIFMGVTFASGSPGATYYFDGVDLEFVTTFTSGTFVPPGTGGWEWEGTADASSSILVPTGTPTVTGALTGAYDALDLTHTDWAGFPSGNSFVTLTNMGIGAAAYMVYKHAWI